MPENPNILLITTDQQRFDTLGAAGNPVIKTPNLDRLASEGVLFENAITPCPLCIPARASILSGYTAGRIDSLENDAVSTLNEYDTFPAALLEAGYHTQAIGKMHFMPGPLYRTRYGMKGMILSEEMRGIRWAQTPDEIVFDDYDKFLVKNGVWGWEKPPEIGYNEIKPLYNPLPPHLHVTRWCGEAVARWLHQDRPEGKPFFLWASFVKPHAPYDCPSHLTDLYNPDDMPDPWIGDEGTNGRNPGFKAKRRNMEFDLYSMEALKRSRANYYANITFIDNEVGRILNTLDETGLSEKTLVIFTSDHGDLMGDHGQWYKSVGYEGSLHVPLILRWPGQVKAGQRTQEVVNLTDIYPTVMNAAGLKPGHGRPGKDLKTFAAGQHYRDFSVSEFGRPPNAHLHLRHKNWKFLWYQNGGFEELYDLKHDPRELKDLSGDSFYHPVMDDLRNLLRKWVNRWSNPELYFKKNGAFLSEPYREEVVENGAWGKSPRPFSRMPWDSRIPPRYVSDDSRSWWWDMAGLDWSTLVGTVINKKETDDE